MLWNKQKIELSRSLSTSQSENHWLYYISITPATNKTKKLSFFFLCEKWLSKKNKNNTQIQGQDLSTCTSLIFTKKYTFTFFFYFKFSLKQCKLCSSFVYDLKTHDQLKIFMYKSILAVLPKDSFMLKKVRYNNFIMKARLKI